MIRFFGDNIYAEEDVFSAYVALTTNVMFVFLLSGRVLEPCKAAGLRESFQIHLF